MFDDGPEFDLRKISAPVMLVTGEGSWDSRSAPSRFDCAGPQLDLLTHQQCGILSFTHSLTWSWFVACLHNVCAVVNQVRSADNEQQHCLVESGPAIEMTTESPDTVGKHCLFLLPRETRLTHHLEIRIAHYSCSP